MGAGQNLNTLFAIFIHANKQQGVPAFSPLTHKS